jgi:hypothetical protein
MCGYATDKIRDRRKMRLTRTVTIGGVSFKAHHVEHSISTPAVGYRVFATAGLFFYLPDVDRLPNPPEALHGLGCKWRRRDAAAHKGANE